MSFWRDSFVSLFWFLSSCGRNEQDHSSILYESLVRLQNVAYGCFLSGLFPSKSPYSKSRSSPSADKKVKSSFLYTYPCLLVAPNDWLKLPMRGLIYVMFPRLYMFLNRFLGYKYLSVHSMSVGLVCIVYPFHRSIRWWCLQFFYHSKGSSQWPHFRATKTTSVPRVLIQSWWYSLSSSSWIFFSY